jgi:hypothetical protein
MMKSSFSRIGKGAIFGMVLATIIEINNNPKITIAIFADEMFICPTTTISTQAFLLDQLAGKMIFTLTGTNRKVMITD